MLVSLVIISFIACSLATEPTCNTANQTLQMDTDCGEALDIVFAGTESNSSTNATAVMMACEGNTECNQNIRAVLDNCPFSDLNLINVLCANDSTLSQRCIDILPDLNSTFGNLLESVAKACITVDGFLIGQCTSRCRLALQNLRISYGCCIPELLQFLNMRGYLSDLYYSLYIATLPSLLCSIENPFCNGVPPPGDFDGCSVAFTNLFGPNDTCTLLIRRMTMSDISALERFNELSTDCLTRFRSFYNNCNDIFAGDPPTELIQIIEGGFTLAAATNNGQSCSLAVPTILTRVNQGEICIQNYFNRLCSEECKEINFL